MKLSSVLALALVASAYAFANSNATTEATATPHQGAAVESTSSAGDTDATDAAKPAVAKASKHKAKKTK